MNISLSQFLVFIANRAFYSARNRLAIDPAELSHSSRVIQRYLFPWNIINRLVTRSYNSFRCESSYTRGTDRIELQFSPSGPRMKTKSKVAPRWIKCPRTATRKVRAAWAPRSRWNATIIENNERAWTPFHVKVPIAEHKLIISGVVIPSERLIVDLFRKDRRSCIGDNKFTVAESFPDNVFHRIYRSSNSLFPFAEQYARNVILQLRNSSPGISNLHLETCIEELTIGVSLELSFITKSTSKLITIW